MHFRMHANPINLFLMRLISLFVCSFVSVSLCFTQPSYIKEYSNYSNSALYEMIISEGSSRLLIVERFGNPGQAAVVKIDNQNGNFIEEVDVTLGVNIRAFRICEHEEMFYILYYIYPTNEVDSILISRIDVQSGNQIANCRIGFPDFILRDAWVFEEDSILLLTHVMPENRIRYIRINAKFLSFEEELLLAPKMGLLVTIYPIRDLENEYLLFAANRVHYWLEKEKIATPILADTVFTYGEIIASIHQDGYVVFGKGYDESQGVGAQLTIVKIDSNLNFVKRVMFGEGSVSYDHPALTSSIDKDNHHYFVSAFKDISLTPYTSTDPKSFYVGKYDEELNEEWLHILGGDKHYFISGVKADGHGGCYVYGFTRPQEYNFQAIPFLMRLNADGMITSVENTQPEQYHITIYGNPGREAFRFGFLAAEQGYRLRLSDLQGRIIADMPVTGGVQEVAMHPHPAGAYIWQLYHPAGRLLDSGKWVKVE
jgi:hypothetical protein